MTKDRLSELRQTIRAATLADEEATLARLVADAGLDDGERAAIGVRATDLVEKVRAGSSTGMLESFLA